jgi:predicted transcriptional regulator
MNSKLLVDAIVRQTTVLIAQLSTAAGIRAPLAHIADQVFLELSREIEAQGVSRRVAADMFGLAIRTYQKKVQRLTGSVTSRGQTLWQAVLEHLQTAGTRSRREVAEHFDGEDPIVLGSVLKDLVSSGLIYRTGSGESQLYGVTKETDRARALREQSRESLDPIVWAVVYRSGRATRAELQEHLAVDAPALQESLQRLEADGRIQSSGEGEARCYSAADLLIPVDAEHGWEAAVFDHFQAVARAIASKVRRGLVRSTHDDVVGGATITFDVWPGHPDYEETLGLLRRVRADVNRVWNRVQRFNEKTAIPEDRKVEVCFYFGQSVISSDEE